MRDLIYCVNLKNEVSHLKESIIEDAMKTRHLQSYSFEILTDHKDYLYNILIERDGEQHYGDNRTSKFFGNQEANDKFKTKLAKKHGYKIARIPFWISEEEEHQEI